MGCKRTQEFLAKNGIETEFVQNAASDPVVGESALALLKGMTELRVGRGRKAVRFDLEQERPSDPELLGSMLGRSGKLRAPAMKIGSTLVIGYNQDLLASVFGRGESG